MFNRFGAWLLTETGKNFALHATTVSGLAAFACNFIPHTLLIDKYKDIVHLYKNGFSVPLPQHLKERFNKAVELTQVPNDEKGLYNPFSVFGFDIFHAGSSYSKFGCIIGIPVNFTYKSVDSIDKNSIKIKGESVVWDSEEGKQFLDAVVLSEKAQIYAMAREIQMTQTLKVFYDSCFSALGIYLAYGLSSGLNTKLNLYAKPRAVRGILYILTGSFALMTYFMAKDTTQMYFEEKIDKTLREKDPIFLEGGLEYYDKILRRNIALRKLMGNEGPSVYSVLGNENYFIRQKHLPLVQRKSFFEEKVNTA